MITSVKEILMKAREGGYAVGAFNTINLETTRAIVEAAQEMRSPIPPTGPAIGSFNGLHMKRIQTQ